MLRFRPALQPFEDRLAPATLALKVAGGTYVSIGVVTPEVPPTPPTTVVAGSVPATPPPPPPGPANM